MPGPTKYDGLEPPTLVEDARGLERLLADLGGQDEIAVDTEADSFYRYRERVCLIQITVEDRDYLIDPLRKLDLTGFGRVLADPRKVKVFHDGEYDVLILKHDFGYRFENLFDTRVAAAALGYASPGLAAVLAERFDVRLDKSLQRSNWSIRPLSPQQIDYARLDTHFLLPLMHDLRGELEERGRTMIVDGECRRLEALEPPLRDFNADEFIRLKGARTLGPSQMQALRELYIMRDHMARERDVPPFKVLGNAALVDAAGALPTSQRQLDRVDGISPRLVRRLGNEILRAVSRAKKKGPLKKAPQLPSRDGTGELDEEQGELHDRLKRWRKNTATRQGMDSSLVLNRRTLLLLAKKRPRSESGLTAVNGLLDWQIREFGDDILAVVHDFEEDLAAGRVELRRRRKTRSRSKDNQRSV
ncbi:MAG: HRDC domain-containing protein [Planctomycetota bacterium]|nr:HRDC domain-containing protein [Planctomycetota bacterium]